MSQLVVIIWMLRPYWGVREQGGIGKYDIQCSSFGLLSVKRKMTYCCALRLEQGLVLISDTRTNAGVDHISVFRKLHTFGIEGERFIALQTAGNLATNKLLLVIYKMF